MRVTIMHRKRRDGRSGFIGDITRKEKVESCTRSSSEGSH